MAAWLPCVRFVKTDADRPESTHRRCGMNGELQRLPAALPGMEMT